jgi:hypothetical protein
MRNLLETKKKKMLWTMLIVALLVSSLSLLMLNASMAAATSLSDPVQLSTDIPGVLGYCVYQLLDGSLVVNSANESCTFLTKLDSGYHLLWSRSVTVSQNATLPRLLPLKDGGFLLAGIIDNQYVMVKTDSEGNMQWTKSYSSGAPINYLMAIIQAGDGGFAMAGFGVPIVDGLGWIWFTKTDAAGNLQWSKNISGPIQDCPSSIIETSDGGYVLSDTSYSFVPDQAFFRLIEIDSEGKLLGNSSYGGYGYYYQPECNLAIKTSDGGYLMGGYLWRKPAWVVKVDSEGVMQWNRTYGEDWCSITDALETPNGYLLVEFAGKNQTGIVLTDKSGLTTWNTALSGVSLPLGLEANFNTIINAQDGGYFMIASKDQTVWLAKLQYPSDSSVAIEVLAVGELALAALLITVLAVQLRVKKISPIISLCTLGFAALGV